MANYDFGNLASPAKDGKKYDFGGLATPSNKAPSGPVYYDIPGTPQYGKDPSIAPPAEEPNDNALGKIAGAAIETPLSLASSTVLAPVAAAYGLTGGKDVKEQNRRIDKVMDYAYHPTTAAGKSITKKVGDFVEDSGIAGIPMTSEFSMAAEGVPRVKPSIRDASASARKAVIESPEVDAIKGGINSVKDKVPFSPRKDNGLAGVGAAMTPEETIRAERAASLPVPIQLTKGQKSRTFEQQKFERETAKLPEGEPLRERFAQQNEQVLKNFDAFDDLTGSQERSLRSVGKSVNEALVLKQKLVKAEIAKAYKKAREAGDMEVPVDVSPLAEYVKNNVNVSKNAPIVATVKSELSRLSKGKTELTINQLEELRKTIGKASNMQTADAVYGNEMKSLVDSITEGKGGDLYRSARRMHENYSKEFKDKSVIARMLKTKPGTTDRVVAYEDVFKNSILDGSLDDVRAVRKTLQTSGENGNQAWKELQGQTIRHMKDAVTSNVARDIRGNPIVSPASLNKIVTELDKDGKLDFIFGKKGAQQIRDVNDLATDVYTSPPGSVNSSNTASILIGLLDTAVSGVSGMPLPIGTAINYGVKKVKSKALSKKVSDALGNDGLIPPPPR